MKQVFSIGPENASLNFTGAIDFRDGEQVLHVVPPQPDQQPAKTEPADGTPESS
jgi:hypothetical protein